MPHSPPGLHRRDMATDGQLMHGSEGSIGPPSLRCACLRLLATAISLPEGSSSSDSSDSGDSFSWAAQRVCTLPAELRQDLLCLLASWRLLTDAACAALQPACFLIGMATLDLSGCSLLCSRVLRTHVFACQLPHLISLSLRGVLHLTNTMLEGILSQCPSLRQLDVSHCYQLGSPAVAAISGSASGVGGNVGSGTKEGVVHRQLESLSLAGCWQVASIGALRACGSLTSLILDGCWQLRSGDVRQALAFLPLLESLSLSGCPQIDSSILVTRQLSLSPPHERGLDYRGPFHLEPVAEEGLDDPLQQQHVDVIGMDPGTPGLPLAGVPLYRLRSLDVSGTAVRNDLLYWVALRCSARLQRLAIGGRKGVDGLGVAAVLAAKQALLEHTFPLAAQLAGQTVQPLLKATSISLHQSAPEVLPLLELSAGSVPSWTPEGAGGPLSSWWQQQQSAYERAQGPLLIHLVPDQPPIPFRLPATTVPAAMATRAAFSAQQHTTGLWPALGGFQEASSPVWPPESVADALLCLGSQGLGQLEALDLSQGGGAVAAAVAAVIGQHCSGLKRLNLSGCQVSDEELREVVVLPCLTRLDVSGCVGSKAAAPGSRFQRHPAKRRQQGGVSDESLALLGLRDCTGSTLNQPSVSPWQHSMQEQGTAQRMLSTTSAAQQGQQQVPLQALVAGGLLITDASISSLTGLESLQIRGCKHLTDTGVLQCLLGCPNLTRLDFGGCSQLTAAALGCSAINGVRSHESPRAASQAGWEQAQHGGSQQVRQAQHAQRDGAGAEDPIKGCSGSLWVAVSSLSNFIPKRAAMPKHAAAAEVLAWLAGNSRAPGLALTDAPASSGMSSELHVADSAGGLGACQRAGRLSSSCQGGDLDSNSSSSRWQRLERGMGLPLGCSPLQKLELHCGSWPALPPGPPAEAGGKGRGGTTAGSSSSIGRGSSFGLHLAALAKCCPQLRSLQLLSAAGLGPGFVGCLAAHCRLLSRLSITDCGQLSSSDGADLAKLPCLLHLNLSGCSSLGDAGLVAYAQAIWQQSPQSVAQAQARAGAAAAAARVMTAPTAAARAGAVAPRGPTPIAGSEQRTCAGAGGLGKSNEAGEDSGTNMSRVEGPQCFLQTLKLDGCSDISNRGVVAVLAAAPHLATLSLRRLWGVGDESVTVALRGSANLRSLLLADSGVRGSFPMLSELVCMRLETLELSRSLSKQAAVAASLEHMGKVCPLLAVKFA